jgi:hypothetical protein
MGMMNCVTVGIREWYRDWAHHPVLVGNGIPTCGVSIGMRITTHEVAFVMKAGARKGGSSVV